MSDPKKWFSCSECGYVINDKAREWGSESPCPNCERLAVEEKYKTDNRNESQPGKLDDDLVMIAVLAGCMAACS